MPSSFYSGINSAPSALPEAIQVFYAKGISSVSTVGNWQVWQKPKWATVINMYCLGSGSSGGGGASRASLAASVAAGGGSGGYSGSTRVTIPAQFIPDQLYISVGVGGDGGAADSAGVAGMNSYISAARLITSGYLYLSANTVNPPAPAAATTVGPAAGAGTIALQSGMVLSYPGLFLAEVSNAGTAGGIPTPSAVTAMNTRLFTNATGGGGLASGSNTNAAGGAITANGVFIQARAGGAAGGGKGERGIFSWSPFYSTGGTGGGSNGTGTGGDGGDAAYGCGGGGGGAGVTGGKGGKGGDGLVIITSL